MLWGTGDQVSVGQWGLRGQTGAFLGPLLTGALAPPLQPHTHPKTLLLWGGGGVPGSRPCPRPVRQDAQACKSDALTMHHGLGARSSLLPAQAVPPPHRAVWV